MIATDKLFFPPCTYSNLLFPQTLEQRRTFVARSSTNGSKSQRIVLAVFRRMVNESTITARVVSDEHFFFSIPIGELLIGLAGRFKANRNGNRSNRYKRDTSVWTSTAATANLYETVNKNGTKQIPCAGYCEYREMIRHRSRR